MLEFTQDIREAAIEYNEMGYHICAWPRRFGKYVEKTLIPKWYTYSFPGASVTDQMNIGINHYLSGTCSIDIDNLELSRKVFSSIGIDLDKLAYQTMCWQGRENTYKILYDGKNLSLPYQWLRVNDDTSTVFELRGLKFDTEIVEEGYMDLLPPSIHPLTKRPYKFLTKLVHKAELPTLPDEIIEVWSNWQHYLPILTKALD